MTYGNPDNWPGVIIPLVEKYSPGRVWRAAVDLLGYPPNLVHTGAEALAIGSELAKGD